MSAEAPHAIHATALVVGEYGVLIRGSSGAGKSSLALALIEDAVRAGRFARLISDDRVRLARLGGQLAATPAAHIAGLVERRGSGIESIAFEPRAILHLVVDLAPDAARLPEAEDKQAQLLGVILPRLVLGAASPRRDQCLNILNRLLELGKIDEALGEK